MSDPNVFGPYDAGSGYVYGDPFRIDRRLGQIFKGQVNTLLERWNCDIPELALQAGEQFLAGVAEAFEIQRFDRTTGQGANEQTVKAVWDAWVAWQADVKKKPGNSVTGSTPTPDGSPPPASSPTCPTPPWTTGSSCTSTAPAGASPGPSPTG